MAITQNEFQAMLDDTAKWIEGDLRWRDDEDHSPAVQFRAEVMSAAGYPLQVNGRFNPLAQKLSFTLLHGSTGRVYALDLGSDHHNPTCNHVGEKHKHTWTDNFRDKSAYVPDDITAGVMDPVNVWVQFCAESKIEHRGTLQAPPPVQMEFPA